MIGLIFDPNDEASNNIAKHIISTYGFEGQGNVFKSDSFKNVSIVKSDTSLLDAEFVDELGLEVAYMLSKHESSAGISSFTTHPTGNWGSEAKLGGKPHMLSEAAALQMLNVLRKVGEAMKKNMLSGLQLTYEATHHGPLLNTPSLFVEIGGNEQTIANKDLARILGDSIMGSLDVEPDFSKVVLGIGSNHFPAKFTKLALEKGYAFSHMFPKYALYNQDGSCNVFMLKQAFEKSRPEPELACLEWSSYNSHERAEIIKILNEIGIEYERV